MEICRNENCDTVLDENTKVYYGGIKQDGTKGCSKLCKSCFALNKKRAKDAYKQKNRRICTDCSVLKNGDSYTYIADNVCRMCKNGGFKKVTKVKNTTKKVAKVKTVKTVKKIIGG